MIAPAGRGAAFSPGPASGPASSDLAAELAERLEQDLDYQILRKSFDLESSTSLRPAADAAHSGRSAATRSPAGSAGQSAALRLGDGSVEAAGFDLQVTWSQVSTARFELTATSGDANLAMRFESLQSQSFQLNLQAGNGAPVNTSDPLVLDLSGQGIATTGVAAGVRFDLTGDGQEEQVSFATGGSWFLALDRNENGQIDDGRELFGDQLGASNGFAELARYDDNADGRIDADDEVFARLRLFQVDAAGERVNKALTETTVTAIDLGYQNTRKALNLYDSVAQTGHFERADGGTGEAADVLLGYRAIA